MRHPGSSWGHETFAGGKTGKTFATNCKFNSFVLFIFRLQMKTKLMGNPRTAATRADERHRSRSATRYQDAGAKVTPPPAPAPAPAPASGTEHNECLLTN